MNAPFSTSNALARRKTVEDLVELRDKALALYAVAHEQIVVADKGIGDALLAHHAATNGETVYNSHLRPEKLHFHNRLKIAPRADYLDIARRLVDTDCWSHVIAITDLETMMDKKAKDELHQSLIGDPPEFTFDNVMATLERFMVDAGTIWRRGIANCFSNLDRRFRSHDGWKIGGRIIIDRVFDEYGSWCYSRNHEATFMDVERVFKMLDGNKPTHCDLTWALRQKRGWGAAQTYLETDYFRIRVWKNGNVHVYFKRDDLLEKVNQLLGEYYGAPIPTDRDHEKGEAESDLFAAKTTPAKRYGFFPTPPEAVETFLDDLPRYQEKGKPRLTWLEPSAGTGNLARPLATNKSYPAHVDCVEVQPALAEALRDEGIFRKVITADFLQLDPATTGLYDRVAMNPPFDRERDIDHVMHALKFLKPGGCLRAIMSAGTEFRDTKKSRAFRQLMNSMGAEWRDMPAGSFASVGTNCNTGKLTVWKDGKDQSSRWRRKAFPEEN